MSVEKFFQGTALVLAVTGFGVFDWNMYKMVAMDPYQRQTHVKCKIHNKECSQEELSIAEQYKQNKESFANKAISGGIFWVAGAGLFRIAGGDPDRQTPKRRPSQQHRPTVHRRS